ncbi:hypothetical protein GCM10011383_44730 [Hymenobacter cavernae]|uniref:CHAT domain-containing protein n=2 Tax=Hymenobacter cavernae TaxID=2044852 RepID=A0ABQ1UXV1_9BACT|nr:hypothetical protein GCM10011383_44730 [Hymenobacter cavernae]
MNLDEALLRHQELYRLLDTLLIRKTLNEYVNLPNGEAGSYIIHHKELLTQVAYRELESLLTQYIYSPRLHANLLNCQVQLAQAAAQIIIYSTEWLDKRFLLINGLPWLTHASVSIYFTQLTAHEPNMAERVEVIKEAINQCVILGSEATVKEIELSALIERINETAGDARIPLVRRALEFMQDRRDREWASLQLKLGLSLKNSSSGDKARNIEAAIQAFDQALKIYNREQYAEDWATTQTALGNAYINRLSGDNAENIEKAIQAYKLALEVFTQEEYPEGWGNTQFNLGNAYGDRMEDRALNIEAAIQAYQNALQVFTHEYFPERRGRIQNNLGNAYLKRLEGEEKENQELAICAFEQALQIAAYRDDAQEWARTQFNLANAYHGRVNGTLAENIECAINAYKHALEVYGLDTHSEQLASVQQGLGNAYLARQQGERSQNFEDALDAYNSALQFFTKEDHPERWASILNSLNHLYIYRLREDWEQNLEKAVAASKSILEVFTRESNIKIWGNAQLSLGNAYAKRLLGNRYENFTLALEAYDLAAQAYGQDQDFEKWAGVQINIGNIYFEPLEGNRFRSVEDAINAYTLALQVCTQAHYPEDWAIIQVNLGAAYRWRLQGEHSKNIEDAIIAYKSALQIYTKDHHTRLYLDVSYYLGELLYEDKQWFNAKKAYEDAHDALVLLREGTHRQESRSYLSRENAELYANLIHCCLQLNDYAAAATYALSSKSRTLTELIAGSSSSLDELLSQDPALRAEWLPIQELQDELDSLLEPLGASAPLTTNRYWQERQANGVDTRIALLRQEINQRSDTLLFRFPVLASVQPLPQLSADQVQKLSAELGGVPLIEYVQHGGGWCVFVITPEAVHYVSLADNLLELLIDALEAIIADTFWIQGGQLVDQSTSLKNMYSLLIAPLKACISVIGPLLLAPTGPLHLVPFQALVDERGRYLSEDCAINFVPSAATTYVLYSQIKAQSIEQNNAAKQRLLSIAYSDANGNYLPSVISEAKAICKHFTETIELLEDESLPEQVIQATSQPFEVIHIGCHGSFSYASPLDSGLLLAQQHLLTINDIRLRVRLQGRPLVTLSACQTGHTRPERADETNGLSWAFLAAGASAVVSSQWSVADDATRELFEAFYAIRRQAQISNAEALRQAIQHLRQKLDYQQIPFFWAAFQVMGLPLSA